MRILLVTNRISTFLEELSRWQSISLRCTTA